MIRRWMRGNALLLPLAASLAAAACASENHEIADAAQRAQIPVRVAQASLQELATGFEVGGEVRARERAAIASRIMATVLEVKVKAGDRVRAGQPLVVLDARDLEASRVRAQAALVAAQEASRLATADRQAAQAALDLAAATHTRISELRGRNSATPHEFDEAQAGLRAAQARVQSADAQVAQALAGIEVARAAAEGAAVTASYAVLTAPFDGLVTEKLVEPGNMASPGASLLTVEDTRAFRLEVRVDESRAALAPLNGTVDVVLDSPAGAATRTAGRIAEIARVLDPGAHTFLAKIDLPVVEGLRSGMFARARFAGPPHDELAIPAGSVTRQGQLTSVFVVDETATARLRLVTVGEPAGDLVEVRAGLDTGEQVVLEPPSALVDGSRVRVEARR